MNYKNSSQAIQDRKNIGKYFQEYPYQQYNTNWLTFGTLTHNQNHYFKNIASNYSLINFAKKLKKYSSDEIDGIIVTELSKNKTIHHHFLLTTTSPKYKYSFDNINHLVWKSWGKYGYVKMDKYDQNKEGTYYVSKHLYKTNINMFNTFDTLLDFN